MSIRCYDVIIKVFSIHISEYLTKKYWDKWCWQKTTFFARHTLKNNTGYTRKPYEFTHYFIELYDSEDIYDIYFLLMEHDELVQNIEIREVRYPKAYFDRMFQKYSTKQYNKLDIINYHEEGFASWE